MRRKSRLTLIFFIAVVALASSALQAQDDDKPFDFFAGYSYLRVNPDGDDVDGFNMNGWHAAFSVRAADRLRFMVEFSQHFGDVDVPGEGNEIIDLDDVNQFSMLVGPQYRAVRSDSVNASVHALFGFSRIDLGEEALDADLDDDETDFAMTLGGSFDIKLSDRISWRAIQPDAFFTFFGDDTQVNFRVSTGILIRVGD